MKPHLSMSICDSALLQLVRAGIYDDDALLDGFNGLSPQEWQQVYSQAKRQTVSGVACHAMSKLPHGLLPPYPLMLHWVARTGRIEKAYAGMGDVLASLTELFRSHGITPILQKGHGVARFYPMPQLRVCGDIDFYFTETDRHRADDIIAGMGIKVHRAADHSISYLFAGIAVEHHSTLIDLSSPFRHKTMRRIIDSQPTVTAHLSDGCSAGIIAPLGELLMLNAHIMKHSLGTGIGLRQFCDYALAANTLLPQIGSDSYIDACRSLGIARWTVVLHRFINSYLSPAGTQSLPDNFAPIPAEAVGRLMSVVLEGGNFGHYRPGVDTSRPAWYRKFGTFSAFLRHSAFTLRIAPVEAACIMARLAGGQIHL